MLLHFDYVHQSTDFEIIVMWITRSFRLSKTGFGWVLVAHPILFRLSSVKIQVDLSTEHDYRPVIVDEVPVYPGNVHECVQILPGFASPGCAWVAGHRPYGLVYCTESRVICLASNAFGLLE